MRHVLIVIAALIAIPAGAQDTPRFGLTMGYPAQVGLLWNVSDRVAIRPQIDWTRGSTESTTTTTITRLVSPFPTIPPSLTTVTSTLTTTNATDHWNIGGGAAALIYLWRDDALRTYVAPGFSYSRSTSHVSSTSTSSGDFVGIGTPIPPTTTHSSNYTTTGVFGAQYTLHARFGLFGEVGIAYTHSGEVPNLASLSPSIGDGVRSDATSWSVGIRSGVGIILFF